MKKIIVLAFFFGILLLIHDSESLGRGRGGFGGGAIGGGGFSGGGRAVQSYGGGGIAARSSTPIVGPRGGVGQTGRTSGSYTTKGGSTIDYRGAGIGGTTPGGISGGRYAGGVQVTTPGGREVTRVGSGGGVVGPAGNAIGGRSGATVGSGPGGSFGTKYQGGVAIGPNGAVAGGSRVGAVGGPGGVAVGGSRVGAVGGPGGVAVGGSRAGVAVGPYGAVAGRTTVGAVGTRGTYYRSSTAIRSQGVYVRGAVAHYPCFRAGWYRQYPGAWFAAGWTASAVWRAATWSACASYGYPVEPVYYDYGENVVYQDDGVYVDGTKTASAEEYTQQASALSDTGYNAKVSKEEEWLPLGVFAMVQGEETTSNHIFQLSINKQGVIRGNYYDAVTDTTAQVYGSADKKTQRAAWTVGERKMPVYEAGLANLTKDATTMLVHYSADRSQQFSLVRVEEPKDDKK